MNANSAKSEQGKKVDIKNLFKSFCTKLNNEKSPFLATIGKSGRQVEGWFKAELIYYFNEKEVWSEKDIQKHIEVPYEKNKLRAKCDFCVYGTFLELKHLHVGNQKGNDIKFNGYFNKNEGIPRDIARLKEKEGGFIAVFVTGYNQCCLEQCTVKAIEEKSKEGVEFDFAGENFIFFLLKVDKNN